VETTENANVSPSIPQEKSKIKVEPIASEEAIELAEADLDTNQPNSALPKSIGLMPEFPIFDEREHSITFDLKEELKHSAYRQSMLRS
jgi:hypothetical protein